MEFKSKELGLRFTVSDKPTVRQQLDYRGWLFALRDNDIFWRQWKAATALIKEWDCQHIPDFQHVYESRLADDEPEDAIYLDEATNPRVTEILLFVGAEVGIYVANLEDMPKN